MRTLIPFLIGLVAALSLSAEALCDPPPGQGGNWRGTTRDYDGFLFNYPSSDHAVPGAAATAPPSSPQFAPLAPPGAPGWPAVVQPFDQERPDLRELAQLALPWIYRSHGGYFYAEVRSPDGARYYWVYWPSVAKQYFYCYDPAQGQYVGLYDFAVRIYRPYNSRRKQWEEAAPLPVPAPRESPQLPLREKSTQPGLSPER